MVVICDRWPQMQFAGELDGPRLTHWAEGSAWQRRLAAYELRPYELAAPVPARPRRPARRRRGHRVAASSRGRARLPRAPHRARACAHVRGFPVRRGRHRRRPSLPTRCSPRSCARSGHACKRVGTVVEFCGLPGAGKSTIARALVASLRLHGIPTTEVMAPIGPSAGRAARLRRKSAVIARRRDEPRRRRARDEHRVAQRPDRRARPGRTSREPARRPRRGPTRATRAPACTSSTRDRCRSGGRRPCAPTTPGCSCGRPPIRHPVPISWCAWTCRPTSSPPVLARRAERQSRLEGVDGAALDAEMERGAALLDVLCEQLVHSPGTHRPVLIRVDGFGSGAVDSVGEALRGLGWPGAAGEAT